MPQFIEITDFNDPRLDVYARLTEAQLLSRQDAQKACSSPKAPR